MRDFHIGDRVTFFGRVYFVRGLSPMSIRRPTLHLEDEETGERVEVAIGELTDGVARAGLHWKAVMGSREERLGENEALFRQVNERIAEMGERLEVDQLEIVCECAKIGCSERVVISPSAYEQARKSDVTFIVIDGHVDPSIERVVLRGGPYVLVEKMGDAADAAEAAAEL